MKIIDLFNKMANGEEVPKKILWKDIIFIFSSSISNPNFSNSFKSTLSFIFNIINSLHFLNYSLALKLYIGLIIFSTSTVSLMCSIISSIGLYTIGASSIVSSFTDVV